MRKRSEIFVFFMIMIGLLSVNNINAFVGIAPAITEAPYSDNMKFQVNYQLLTDDALGTKYDIYVVGNFKDYVKLDKTELESGVDTYFSAYIDVPKGVLQPGPNSVTIRVKQRVKPGAGIGVRIEVGAGIKIFAPYPGKYAVMNGYAAYDVNEGERTNFTMTVSSLGDQELSGQAYIDIFKDNVKIEEFNIGYISFQPQERKIISKLSSKNYNPGFYDSDAYFVYLNNSNDRVVRNLSDFFRVGTLFVNITNYTKEVLQGKINPYYVEVESLWNNDLENVYAEVNITNLENVSMNDIFKTPSFTLKGWEKTKLEGHFNAENFAPGEYNADITLHYEGEINNLTYMIKVKSPEKEVNYMFIIIIIVIIIIMIIIIIGIFIIFKLYRKLNKMKKDSNNSSNTKTNTKIIIKKKIVK